jgi:hypothetical protein
MIDIKHNKCIHDGCNKNPSYNNKGEKHPIYCVSHKLDGMIDVHNELCIYENCTKRQLYNYKNEKNGLYCKNHKLNNMIDIMNKRCKTELCDTMISTNKYKGYCLYCFIHLFPNEKVSRNYKTKEYAVVEYITTTFQTLDWVSDKKIQDGCSRKRPDLLLDLGYHIIIIEIDENQHIDYDCSCENKRLMELSQDVGHRPIVFIRFNPDEYINDDKQITSCWSLNTSGICSVKKSKKKEWDERLNALKLQVEYWLANTTDKTIEIIQLFYDQ